MKKSLLLFLLSILAAQAFAAGPLRYAYSDGTNFYMSPSGVVTNPIGPVTANIFTGPGTTGTVTSTAGDAGKYYKADGSWDTPVGGSGGDVYTTSNNTFAAGSTNTMPLLVGPMDSDLDLRSSTSSVAGRVQLTEGGALISGGGAGTESAVIGVLGGNTMSPGRITLNATNSVSVLTGSTPATRFMWNPDGSMNAYGNSLTNLLWLKFTTGWYLYAGGMGDQPYWSDGVSLIQIWTDGNDGTGSGLDADTLDGNDSAAFAAAAHNHDAAYDALGAAAASSNGVLAQLATSNLVTAAQQSAATGAVYSAAASGWAAADAAVSNALVAQTLVLGTTNAFVGDVWMSGTTPVRLASTAYIYVTNTTAWDNIQANIDAVPRDLGGWSLIVELSPGDYTNGFGVQLSGFVDGEVYLRETNYVASNAVRPTPTVNLTITNVYAAVASWWGDASYHIQGLQINTTAGTSMHCAIQKDQFMAVDECYLKNLHSVAQSVGLCSFGYAARGRFRYCLIDKLTRGVQSNQGGWIYVSGSRTNGTTCTQGVWSYGGIIHRGDALVMGTTDNVVGVGGIVIRSAGSIFP